MNGPVHNGNPSSLPFLLSCTRLKNSSAVRKLHTGCCTLVFLLFTCELLLNLMAVDADDATSALIAQLLSEDNPYYSPEEWDVSCSSESDSSPKRKSKPRAQSHALARIPVLETRLLFFVRLLS